MLELRPLYTATYRLEPSLMLGTGPRGAMTIGAVRSVDLKGERIRATLAGPAAADWMLTTGHIGVIDVRLALRTDDGALIYLTYGGRIDLSQIASGQGTAFVAPTFETGDERYAWLNAVQAIGTGAYTPDAEGGRLDYEVFEVCKAA